MKPRLDRAPLTPEDEAIRERYRVGHGLLFLADTGAEIQGDRRDADLMYEQAKQTPDCVVIFIPEVLTIHIIAGRRERERYRRLRREALRIGGTTIGRQHNVVRIMTEQR